IVLEQVLREIRQVSVRSLTFLFRQTRLLSGDALMKFFVILAALLTCSYFLVADDEGHHHEDMNEVQVGTVHFPSSCAAAVQKPLERGVAMLHSFWYEEAEKQFQQIEKEDPQCAIAHWGVAM